MASSGEGAGLEGMRAVDRDRLEALLARQWSLAAEHPLARLHGQRLGEYRMLVLLGPKNNVGSRYFQLFLSDDAGRLPERSLALGLHNSGPFPAYNWIELMRYESILAFDGDTLDLAAEGLDQLLFETLSELVPAGGHIMVEYDSPSQTASERVLTLGYPPAASPLGYLMFRAGCRSYRDWYISEGGREGPRKLQGFKPWNQEIAREKSEALRRELAAFLSEANTARESEWRRLARRLAKEALETLEQESPK